MVDAAVYRLDPHDAPRPVGSAPHAPPAAGRRRRGPAAAAALAAVLAVALGAGLGLAIAWHGRDGRDLLIGALLALQAATLAAAALGLHTLRRRQRQALQALSDGQARQLQRVQAEAAERSRWLAAAAHDLRQPMHALGLFAQALERRVTDPAGRPLLLNMNRCIEALERSFHAILDMSRLEAGSVEPALQSFPVREVFRRLHLHFAGQAEALGLDLRLRAGGQFVRSDPVLLERVLGNLVANALRHTRRGGVIVVARNRGDGVSLEVWDSGCGIHADDLPHVFDEFWRGRDQPADRGRGLGIGLAIVKRLVRLLGHPLTVRSQRGRGTRFALWVPRTDLGVLHAVSLDAETQPMPLESGRTVLLVDDDAAVRDGTAQLLGHWGWEVVAVADAAAAADAALGCADRLHVLVCDLHLGAGEHGDGLAAIERVRAALGHPLPALLVTGDAAALQGVRVQAAGHPVLLKPVPPKDLHAALRRLVGAPM